MPFVDDAGRPLDRVPLVYRGGRMFQLAGAIGWIDPSTGELTRVEPHDLARPATDPQNGTDLASVPPFLWGLVASYGRQTLPAILHDRLVDGVDLLPFRDQDRHREKADAVFRRSLEDAGVPAARATVMWATVRVASIWYLSRGLGVLLVAQLVLAAAAGIAGVALPLAGHPLGALLLAAPALSGLLWGRRWRTVVIAAQLAPLYAPIVLGAAAVSALEYLVSLILWLATGGRGATPRPGPTVAARRRGSGSPDAGNGSGGTPRRGTSRR